MAHTTATQAAAYTGGTRHASTHGESLPWFADDLSPEDLALVLATTRTETKVRATPAKVQTERLQSTAIQWEGYLDDATKRRLILGDPREMDESKHKVGHYVALDCEMVGIGPRGTGSALARVSIVNWYGQVVLDRFVKPKERVTDYRTWVSGVRPSDLRDAPSFATVQDEVAKIIHGRVLVGHAIEHDLRALRLAHPRPMIRDTASFQPLRDIAQNKTPSLRVLAERVLGIEIQRKGQEHNSIEDAQATMAVFRTQKAAWDNALGIKSKAQKRSGTDLSNDLRKSPRSSSEPDVHPQDTSPPTHPRPRRHSTARPRAADEWWRDE